MHLHHLPLPYLTPYTTALAIQSRLLTAHLAHLSFSPTSSTPKPLTSHPHPSPPPPPTLLTFTPPPTFAPGRREAAYSPSVIHSLTTSPISSLPPTFLPPQPRGGLLTYHGPGQLVGFLICHLPTHHLSLRAYIHLLEESIIRLAGRFYGVGGFRSEVNPGVWVSETGEVGAGGGVGEEEGGGVWGGSECHGGGGGGV